MEKASFAIYNLANRALSEKQPVQYNPEHCDIKKSNQTAGAGGRGGLAYSEFVGRELSHLSMELLFDIYDATASTQKDVREAQPCYKNLRTVYTQVDSDAHSPPVIQFSWGKLLFFGFITSLKEKTTMFSPTGVPVRARVSVELEGCTQEDQNTKPNNSPDRTKMHTVTQGETIWEISSREYGSTGSWRVIAKANGIENPRRLPAASVIHIPALPGGEVK